MIVTVPLAFMVAVEAEIVRIDPLLLVKITGRPELAAPIGNVCCDKLAVFVVVKLIVWVALLIVTVFVAVAAR